MAEYVAAHGVPPAVQFTRSPGSAVQGLCWACSINSVFLIKGYSGGYSTFFGGAEPWTPAMSTQAATAAVERIARELKLILRERSGSQDLFADSVVDWQIKVRYLEFLFPTILLRTVTSQQRNITPNQLRSVNTSPRPPLRNKVASKERRFAIGRWSLVLS